MPLGLAWKGVMGSVGIFLTGWRIATGALISIVSALGAAWETVKGVLEGIVTFMPRLFARMIRAIKDVLGIHSPSTVFIEIGKDIIRGFVAGVRAAAGLLWEGAKWLGRRVVQQRPDARSRASRTWAARSSAGWAGDHERGVAPVGAGQAAGAQHDHRLQADEGRRGGPGEWLYDEDQGRGHRSSARSSRGSARASSTASSRASRTAQGRPRRDARAGRGDHQGRVGRSSRFTRRRG